MPPKLSDPMGAALVDTCCGALLGNCPARMAMGQMGDFALLSQFGGFGQFIAAVVS